MFRTSGERLLLLGAVLLPAVLILNAAVSYLDAQRLLASEAQITHTYRVLGGVERVVGLVRDAETAHRGYFITGESSYLAPYHDAVPQVEQALADLEGAVAGDAAQEERMEALRRHTTRRLDQLSHTVGVYGDEGMDAARAAMLTGAGRAEMDALRAVAADMRQHESDLLEERQRDVDRSIARVPLTLGLATLVALGLLVALLVVFRQLLRARQQTEAVLVQRRDELEALVLERTRALAEANAELRDEVEQRRRTEERLRSSSAELERSNRELEDFAFVASHDLQEPLRKIQLFSDRVTRRANGALPAEMAEDIERMRAAVTRMRVLVRDLLAYARVGRAERERHRVELGATLTEVLHDLATAIEESGAHVEVGPLPAVEGDPAQLRQLFQNLVGNALKFSQPEGAPHVRVAEEPAGGEESAYVSIAVIDNGIGFDPKHAQRIFSPFERLHTGPQYPGTGIGLAFCRRIVEGHGGSISARSVPGEGATFTVTLPRTSTPPVDEPRAAVRDDPHGR